MRIILVLLLALGFTGTANAADFETSCTLCHGDPDTFEDGKTPTCVFVVGQLGYGRM